MPATKAITTDYDPRYDRAQTIEGAQGRYISADLPDYDVVALEADLERLLIRGENPDRNAMDEHKAFLGATTV